MAKNREWSYGEEQLLIENYHTSTIKELIKLIPTRNEESINSKIKRLKSQNKLKEKTEDTIDRAYRQRRKDI